jgi:hypothetical protein
MLIMSELFVRATFFLVLLFSFSLFYNCLLTVAHNLETDVQVQPLRLTDTPQSKRP